MLCNVPARAWQSNRGRVEQWRRRHLGLAGRSWAAIRAMIRNQYQADKRSISQHVPVGTHFQDSAALCFAGQPRTVDGLPKRYSNITELLECPVQPGNLFKVAAHKAANLESSFLPLCVPCVFVRLSSSLLTSFESSWITAARTLSLETLLSAASQALRCRSIAAQLVDIEEVPTRPPWSHQDKRQPRLPSSKSSSPR